jgi:ribosomal protein L11 methyltransferase
MRDWPSVVLTFPDGAAAALRDLVSAHLDPDSVAAIEERSDAEWLVSFRDEAGRDAAAAALREAFGPHGLRLDNRDVSDGDWARRSQAALGAVTVGRLTVAPPWLPPDQSQPPGHIHLIIEPSMGFGSGHHATTRLCLTALQSLPVADARVLDIGTGSGILALAAARLGAASVTGTDNDPDALASAEAAASVNGLAGQVQFLLADFRHTPPPPADIVLANLTGAMLVANAAAIAACMAPGGRLILSGITTAEADAVLEAFTTRAPLQWRGDEDGWVGLVMGR